MYQQAVTSPFLNRVRLAEMEVLREKERTLLMAQATRRREARARDQRFRLLAETFSQTLDRLVGAHNRAATAMCGAYTHPQQREARALYQQFYRLNDATLQSWGRLFDAHESAATASNGALNYEYTQQHLELLNEYMPHYLHAQGSTQETEPVIQHEDPSEEDDEQIPSQDPQDPPGEPEDSDPLA